MFDELLNSIKDIVGAFCKATDSFAKVNLHEHMNEMLGFVGVESYTVGGERYSDFQGLKHSNSDVKLRIDLLASKNMSADDIIGIADSMVRLILTQNLGLASINRLPCEYSKVYSRYTCSVELRVAFPIDTLGNAGESVSVNGVILPFVSSYKISRGVKTNQLATLDGAMISDVVCNEAVKVMLMCKVAMADSTAVYNSLSGYLGAFNLLSIGENHYNNMVATSLESKPLDDRISQVTIEFTEVNH